MSTPWIDISVPLRSGMVHWPGDPGVEITRVHDMERGDANNVSLLSMGAHTGTHMDAPLHFIAGGAAIDQMEFEATVGKVRVIGIEHPRFIPVDELRPHRLSRGERVLFRTRNSQGCWQSDHFMEDFVYIPEDTARYLTECGVRTVGVDYLSVGGYEANGSEIHRLLLDAGIWIVEGLDLSTVAPGNYELVCLPLRIPGGDGAPARAIIRRTED
jgi:arylformamidase